VSGSLILVQVLSGLADAMVLFLVASGLSLIFGVTRIVNFAHGSFFMLAAYLTYSFAARLPLGAGSFYVAVLLAALAAGLLGLVVEVLLLRRIYRAPELYQLLATFALVLVLADLVRFVWGSENLTGPPAPGLAGAVPVWGQLFPTYDLALIGLGPVVALGLWALFYRTRWGILIRAATLDREMVAVLGVDEARLYTAVFALGSGLAGLAGALEVPRRALTNVMDTTVLTEAFVVVVVGGMGSVGGAFLAAVLFGLSDAFGVLVLPGASLVLMFALMAVILIVRPRGLLGRPAATPERPADPELGPTPRAGRGWGWAALGALVLGPPLLPTYWVWLLVEVLAFALFAASLHLLMGAGGMVSFGHAAAFGLGAYAAALLMLRAGLPMPAAFAGAPVVVAAASALIGAFCVRLTSIYFAMLTLAFAQIGYAVVHQWYQLTGGDNGLLGVWPAPWLASPLHFYWLALAACGGGLGLLSLVEEAPFGLTLRAVRDHAPRAAAVGVRVQRHQLLAFVIAGFFGGLAGATFVYLKGSAFPDYLALPVSVEALVMVLLGGVGTLAGAPVGAAVYKLLDTVVTRYTVYWQAVLGALLLLLVLTFPRGIVGTVRGRPR
jgi:branched-chain amino acid transport system permease protein